MKLFCKHDYEIVKIWDCVFKYDDNCKVPTPIDFLVCKKCGKRKLLRDVDWKYNDSVLRRAALWEKGEISLEELDSCWN